MARFGAGEDEGWAPWREIPLGSVACSPSAFGDPNSGTTKSCQCADGAGPIAEAAAQGRALAHCAAEGGHCRWEQLQHIIRQAVVGISGGGQFT